MGFVGLGVGFCDMICDFNDFELSVGIWAVSLMIARGFFMILVGNLMIRCRFL